MRSGGEVSLFYALFPRLTTCTKVMYSGMLMILNGLPSTLPCATLPVEELRKLSAAKELSSLAASVLSYPSDCHVFFFSESSNQEPS